jgi:hypothetical protein
MIIVVIICFVVCACFVLLLFCFSVFAWKDLKLGKVVKVPSCFGYSGHLWNFQGLGARIKGKFS